LKQCVHLDFKCLPHPWQRRAALIRIRHWRRYGMGSRFSLRGFISQS
jgi:hypothetical protein